MAQSLFLHDRVSHMTAVQCRRQLFCPALTVGSLKRNGARQGISRLDCPAVEQAAASQRSIGGTITSLTLAFNSIPTLEPLGTLLLGGDDDEDDDSVLLNRATPPPAPPRVLFGALQSLDVRHNKLRSLRGIGACRFLRRILACGNPNLKSMAPLLE